MKGGLGTASVALPSGALVGAIAVVNAVGAPFDANGRLYAAQWVDDESRRPAAPTERPPNPASPAADGFNTSLAVVATSARLDRAQARRMAASGHDGLARSLRPVHTLRDGDTVFALATGDVDVTDPVLDIAAVQAAAADAVTLAVLDAVLEATGVHTSMGGVPGYCEMFPSVATRLGG